MQRVSLEDFNGTDSFDISFNGGAAQTITNGTNYTLDGIKAAIDAAIGGGATVTVTNWHGEDAGALDQNGFTVTFDSDVDEPPLVLSNFTGGSSGFVRDAVVGGPRTNGGTVTATSNKAPDVQTAPGFTIPVRTPFTLTATGTDANPADTLTYLWEQNDPGTGRTLGTEPGNLGPLFRVFGVAQRTDTGAVYNSTPKNATTTNPARDFPDVAQVMADNTDAVNACGSVTTDAGNDCWSEYLPKVNRTMDFRVTARDGNPQAGGTGFADTALTVSAAAGPFRLTSQATDTDNGTAATLPVTWDVAGTDAAPINTANVRILLSTDDGASFPTVLAASTPNDGSETVALPAGVQTTTGRIRIEAVGNVFFDASRGRLSFDRTKEPPPSGRWRWRWHVGWRHDHHHEYDDHADHPAAPARHAGRADERHDPPERRQGAELPAHRRGHGQGHRGSRRRPDRDRRDRAGQGEGELGRQPEAEVGQGPGHGGQGDDAEAQADPARQEPAAVGRARQAQGDGEDLGEGRADRPAANGREVHRAPEG